MTLFKMGRYDQSLEALSSLPGPPDSTLAANPKACNIFHSCNGTAAMEVIDAHCDSKTEDVHDLVRHDIVAFKEGEKALQVLPRLVEIPEAKLNLAIYYLKHDNIEAAAELIGDMEADSPQFHLVLGLLNTELSQMKRDLKQANAKRHFQCMGQSSTECDTIPGRQCMASYFYLINQFDNVNFYLDSINASFKRTMATSTGTMAFHFQL